MGFLVNVLPMNVFPLILVILYENADLAQKYINFDIATVIDTYNFLFLIAALLLATLSYEMIKAAMFAPKGSGTWVDFIMSFFLLMGIIVYIVTTIKGGGKPSLLIVLIAEAQFLDVMVGFYLVITNARRDFNTSG